MKITVLCVGRVKEKYFAGAISEYMKRLTRYCRPEIIAVPDEKTPENAPPAVEQKIRETEGARLIGKMSPDAYRVALAIDGKMLSSEELSGFLSERMVRGVSHLEFLIGGSLGLSEEVLRKADFRLSFSRMTFPHQLMRVILLEQVYRGFKIMAGEPYHK